MFAVIIPLCAARYFRCHSAMSIKTTLHATAPLLYPCRRYPKCPWGLYASPPPVAMAAVRWFLCFSAFFLEKWVFFSHTPLAAKKNVYATYTKRKKFPSKKKRDLRQKKKVHATYAKKKSYATYAKKKSNLRLFPQLSYAFLYRIQLTVSQLHKAHIFVKRERSARPHPLTFPNPYLSRRAGGGSLGQPQNFAGVHYNSI